MGHGSELASVAMLGPSSSSPNSRPKANVSFGVLGPVSMSLDGERAVLPAGKPTTLLACLLLRPNLVVSTDRLKGAIWNHQDVGNTSLHTCVRRLRQMLTTHGADGAVIETVGGGYRIEVETSALDLTRFRRLVDLARGASGPIDELGLLRLALAEWHGPELGNVTSDLLHRDEVPRLVDERLSAHERAVDLELGLERCRDVLAELWELTRAYPDRERFWEQLIEALYRTGRQVEALAEYRSVKGHLRDQLGIDPGPVLQRLELTILRGESVVPSSAIPTAPPAPTATPASVAPTVDSPRPRLPGPPQGAPVFVGRTAETADLIRLLTSPTGPTTIVLSGAPGIGKTALAVHAAEQVRGRYPGGLMAIRMIDADDRPRPTSELVAEIMATTRPTTRRLVVLDDVVDADAAAAVVAASKVDATLVTSRVALDGLVATRPGGHVRRVLRLAPEESQEFLVAVLGGARLARDPVAAARLAEVCDHYPLALRIASTRLLARPLLSIADYVDWLAERPIRRLSLGVDDRLSVSSVLGAALRRLDPCLADGFLRIASTTASGGELTAAGCETALHGTTLSAEDTLHLLADAGLLEERRPGHFHLHELLRLFARTEHDQTTGGPDEDQYQPDREQAGPEQSSPDRPRQSDHNRSR
jgi:DNA-binding SARP family transcriptional activator